MTIEDVLHPKDVITYAVLEKFGTKRMRAGNQEVWALAGIYYDVEIVNDYEYVINKSQHQKGKKGA